MTDDEFIGNGNLFFSAHRESGATRTTCRFAAYIDFREPGISGPYAGRESDLRLMDTSTTCGGDAVIWVEERPVLGLLRNSKTHALHENESRTSVEILSLFIFKRTYSGCSRSVSLMRDEFRNSPVLPIDDRVEPPFRHYGGALVEATRRPSPDCGSHTRMDEPLRSKALAISAQKREPPFAVPKRLRDLPIIENAKRSRLERRSAELDYRFKARILRIRAIRAIGDISNWSRSEADSPMQAKKGAL